MFFRENEAHFEKSYFCPKSKTIAFAFCEKEADFE